MPHGDICVHTMTKAGCAAKSMTAFSPLMTKNGQSARPEINTSGEMEKGAAGIPV